MSATPNIIQIEKRVHFTRRRHKHCRLNVGIIGIARSVYPELKSLHSLKTPWAQ